MVETSSYGDMGYLARHLPFKENPELLLPGVRSAYVVIKNYKNTAEKHLTGDNKVARYAAGLDYHSVIGAKLVQLSQMIETQIPTIRTYYGVDSRPLPERTLAILAGLGFKGKNSMVIRPKLGSYFFIGVLLLTEEIPFDTPMIGGCGTCTRCIDSCPPHAIGTDGSFNITACTSYQTIEQKAAMSDSQKTTSNGWIFGCDICQEVCPFNHDKTPITDWVELMPESGVGHHLADGNGTELIIPKTTALYRSRQRVRLNISPRSPLA